MLKKFAHICFISSFICISAAVIKAAFFEKAASIGIIGTLDGPTAFYIADKVTSDKYNIKKIFCLSSALLFETGYILKSIEKNKQIK